MKIKLFGIAITIMLIFSVQTTIATPGTLNVKYNKNPKELNFNNDVVEMINQVDESLILYYLENLVSFGPRFVGSDNCSKAADFIYNEFLKMGLNAKKERWIYIKYQCQNVVATVEGTDPNSDAIFIICAHYDTTKNSPGANDDGSGIAAMLAIANICSNYSFEHTIRFIAFSGEEVGTYGSFAYAKKVYKRGDNIRAVLNLETFGYTSEGGKELFVLKTERAEWLSQFSQEISKKYFDLIKLNIITNGNRPCDHQAFLEYGYDAIQYVQLNRDDYPIHTPEDSLDKINFSYLSQVTKLILAIAVELANKPIDLQVRITTPYEGYLYFRDVIALPLPGFNLWITGFRAMTYIFGNTTARVEITTDSNIESVFFCIDGISDMGAEFKEPPYEWEIQKPVWSLFPLIGKHKISVYVWTTDGKVAYDEMDIFIISFS
jgi:hypothetical protein